MENENTINVCLGHLPFPSSYQSYFDLMVSPRVLDGVERLALVPDDRFGPNGHTLSEYGQLIWIMNHINEIAGNCEYIRILHYRRFVARHDYSIGERSINHPWSKVIRPEDLGLFAAEFSRSSSEELFNTPIQFDMGVAGQYAKAHVLQDFLMFTHYLVENNIMTPHDAVEFIQMKFLVAANNIGVWKISTFIADFTIIAKAAEFLRSKHFVLRSGGQRRSVGFLLERLQSYLIMRRIQKGAVSALFGYNYTISESKFVSVTQ